MPSDQSRWRVRRFDEAQFEHPTSEAELIALIHAARANGAQLRVRGSAHSVAAAVYTDSFDPETGPTHVCNTVNLADVYVIGDGPEAWPVDARGCNS